MPKPLLWMLLFLLPAVSCFCQQDIKDWLSKRHGGTGRPGKDDFLMIIPVIASNPTAGFMYGLGVSYTYKTFSTDSRLSAISSNASYSTNGLLNLNVRGNVFLDHDKLLLNGDWRYLFNTETTYGLGTQSHSSAVTHLNGYGISKDPSGQVLKYYHIRLHEILSEQLFPSFFAGLGFRYDSYAAIKDETAASGDSARSFHYRYSRGHGFDPRKYITSGACVNLLFDSRDNELNAYRGIYANVSYTMNRTTFGSSKNSDFLQAEYRAFYPLDGQNRNILAFWLYGDFLTRGTAPYLALPALGYDQRQRTGRGYTFGRFRGENLVYAESEYRFPVSPRSGILGGVLFLNLSSASDKGDLTGLLDVVRAGYGSGLRIMLDKKSRTRLEIDAGMGQKSVGFYFGVQETF